MPRASRRRSSCRCPRSSLTGAGIVMPDVESEVDRGRRADRDHADRRRDLRREAAASADDRDRAHRRSRRLSRRSGEARRARRRADQARRRDARASRSSRRPPRPPRRSCRSSASPPRSRRSYLGANSANAPEGWDLPGNIAGRARAVGSGKTAFEDLARADRAEPGNRARDAREGRHQEGSRSRPASNRNSRYPRNSRVRPRRHRRWHHRRRHRTRRRTARPEGRAVREGRLRCGHVVEVEQADPRRVALPRARRDPPGVRVGVGAPRPDARRAAPRAPAAVSRADLRGRATRLRDHERRAVALRFARAVSLAAPSQGLSAASRRRSRSSRSSGPTGCAACSSITTAPPTTRGSCSRTHSTRSRSAPTATRTPRCCASNATPIGGSPASRARPADRKSWTVAARAVILAAGAWTDEMIQRFELPDLRAQAAAPDQGRPHRLAARAPAAGPRDHADLAGRQPRDVRDPVARAHRARHDRHRL